MKSFKTLMTELYDAKKFDKKPAKGEFWVADMIERDFYDGPFSTYDKANKALEKVMYDVDGLDIIYKHPNGKLYLTKGRGNPMKEIRW